VSEIVGVLERERDAKRNSVTIEGVSVFEPLWAFANFVNTLSIDAFFFYLHPFFKYYTPPDTLPFNIPLS